SNPALQPTGFVGLCAPEVVRATDYDHLRNCAGIKEAFDRRGELQIIVTAAGRWECGHSTFYEMLDRHAPASRQALREQGCIGDLLWQPLSRQGGPLRLATESRPMTLLDLDELARFVGAGKQVLLVLGPCSRCRQPKTEVLRSILAA